MLKDYYNEIIPPWDHRYGSLGKLWNSLDYYDVVRYDESGYISYFIPKELILKPYYTNESPTDIHDYLVSTYLVSKLLEYSCDLTQQEYFDLLILKINNKQNRPRCKYCHNLVSYSWRLTKGYGGGGYWMDKVNLFCSRSCSAAYSQNHPEEYPQCVDKSAWYTAGWKTAHILGPEAMKSIRSRSKNKMIKFINLGQPDDICYLYVTHNGIDKFKYGVTQNMEVRQALGLAHYGDIFTYPHILYQDTRLNIAYLEATITLELNSGETLSYDRFKEFIRLYKSILLNGVKNPFKDQ